MLSEYSGPTGVLKAKFRGKWLSWLNLAYAQDKIQLPAHWCEPDWRRALRRVARKSWNVRIQGPYRHGSGVVNYLSRYVHGGPIKDQHLISGDETEVQFRYRDHHDGKEKPMTLKTDHFLSRVMWHVPVKGQHNVRCYGLYAQGAKAKRELIREQWCETQGEAVTETPKVERICPQCGSPLLHRSSTRRKIPFIKSVYPLMHSVAVQHAVQPDRSRPYWFLQWHADESSA